MQELDNFDFNQCDDRFELLEQCKTFKKLLFPYIISHRAREKGKGDQNKGVFAKRAYDGPKIISTETRGEDTPTYSRNV